MAVTSDTTIANLALSAIGTRSTITSLTEISAEAQTINLHYANVRDELLREAHWNFARKQVALSILNDSTQLIPNTVTTGSTVSSSTSVTVPAGLSLTLGSAVTDSKGAIPANSTLISYSGTTAVISAAATSTQSNDTITFTPNAYQPVPLPWVYEYAYPSDCVQMREILPLLPSQQINQYLFGIPNNGTVNNFGGLNRTPVIKYIISTDNLNGQNQTVILTNQPNAIAVYTYEVTNPTAFDPSFVYAFAGRLADRICMALRGDKDLASRALKVADDIVMKAKARDGNEEIRSTNREADWIKARGFAWDYFYPDGPWGGDAVTFGYYG